MKNFVRQQIRHVHIIIFVSYIQPGGAIFFFFFGNIFIYDIVLLLISEETKFFRLRILLVTDE